ncbi:VOC family protein, partial [Streptomyces nigrescens]|uniref:VOC family protein n=1 Tax=Streptomyces nigrescens TaxID=1920 RepID=UPI0036F59C63
PAASCLTVTPEAQSAPALRASGPRMTYTPARILISIVVQDVDALLDRVGPLGGTARGPANDMPWGQRVAHIQDPDGNAVNLTQPL